MAYDTTMKNGRTSCLDTYPTYHITQFPDAFAAVMADNERARRDIQRRKKAVDRAVNKLMYLNRTYRSKEIAYRAIKKLNNIITSIKDRCRYAKNRIKSILRKMNKN